VIFHVYVTYAENMYYQHFSKADNQIQNSSVRMHKLQN